MSKIKASKRNGIFNERDQMERKKCKIIIDEYQQYKKIQTEEKKQSNISQPKPSKYGRPYNVIVTDDLCMALANKEAGKLKPVVAEWPKIEERLNDIIIKYLLDDIDCPIPHFDFGEMYRGYILIQCKDLYSKQVLCNCMAKISETFESLTLTVVPVAQLTFTKNDDFTFTIPSYIPEQSKPDQMAVKCKLPPSGTSHANTAISDSVTKLEIAYERAQSYLKFYARKETLTVKDRKHIRRHERTIRNYHTKTNSQQPEGFQHPINYFETDCIPFRETNNSKEEMLEDFTPSSWGNRSSDYFAKEQEEFPQTEQRSGLNLKQQMREDFPQTSWGNSSSDYFCNPRREVTGENYPQTSLDNFQAVCSNEPQTEEFSPSSWVNRSLDYFGKKQHEFAQTKPRNSMTTKHRNREDFPSTSWRNSSTDYFNNGREEREQKNRQTVSSNEQQTEEFSQTSWRKSSLDYFNQEFPQTCGNDFQTDFSSPSLNMSQSQLGIVGDNERGMLNASYLTDNRRREANYKRSLRYVRQLANLKELTPRQIKYKRKYECFIKKYEKHNAINSGLKYAQKQSETAQEFPQTSEGNFPIETSDSISSKQQMAEEFPQTSWRYTSSDHFNKDQVEEFPQTSWGKSSLNCFNNSREETRAEFPQTIMFQEKITSSPQTSLENALNNSQLQCEPKDVKTSFNSEDKRLAIYKHCLRTLRQLEKLKELTPAQKKCKKKAKTSVRKYEELQANNRNSENKQIPKFPPTSKNYGQPYKESSKELFPTTRVNFDPEQITDFSQTSMANKMPNSSWNSRQPEAESSYEMQESSTQFTNDSMTNNSQNSACKNWLPEVESFKEMIAKSRQRSEFPPNVGGDHFQPELQQKTKFPQMGGNSAANRSRKLDEMSIPNQSWNFCNSAAESSNKWKENPESTQQGFEFSQYNPEAPISPKQWPALPQASMGNLNNFDSLERFEINTELSKEPNNCNTLEECTKAVLEKRIFEFLNAISEDSDAEKTSPKRQDVEIAATSRNPRIENPVKPKATTSRKRGSNYPVVDIITLTDDSESSDLEVVTAGEDVGSVRTQYFKALGYLKKLECRDISTLTEQEEHFKETSKFMVDKYEKLFGFNLKKSKDKSSKKSRWNSSTSTAQKTSSEPNSIFSSGRQSSKPTAIPSENTQSSLWSSSTSTAIPNTSQKNSCAPNSPWGSGQQTFWSSASGSSFQKNMLPFPKKSTEESTADAEHWNPACKHILDTIKSIPDLQIAIIDRSQLDFKLHRNDWSKLEQNLLQCTIREMQKSNNTNKILFDTKYWYYGIKIVQCENLDSLQFIKDFIRSQDTRYDTMPFKELPRRTIVKVWIPPPIIEDAAILKILKEQNYKLYTYGWTVINSRERDKGNGKDLYISVSQTCLERLRMKSGQIRFGNKRLKMILPEEEKRGEDEKKEGP